MTFIGVISESDKRDVSVHLSPTRLSASSRVQGLGSRVAQLHLLDKVRYHDT